MTITNQDYVGIDVAKDKIDVAVHGRKTVAQAANTRRGIARLIRQMHQLNPKLIVAEATGGYEGALVLGLFEAGLPVSLVSPQRVRQYARASGQLAKTDSLDARNLAEYGKNLSRACLWRKVRQAGGFQRWWAGENSWWRCKKRRKTACGWRMGRSEPHLKR